MPDLAPWLPLLALPFDAEVADTPEVDEIDPAFRRDKLHEVLEQMLMRLLLMPTTVLVEDAHWLDDASQLLIRRLAQPAARPWLLCVTRRPGGPSIDSAPRDGARAPAASGRGLTLARPRGGRRPAALREGAGRGPDGACGQPALHAGARRVSARRRLAAGDDRDAADHPHRHARAGRPRAPSSRGGDRAHVRARPPRGDLARRGQRRPGAVAEARRLRRLAGRRHAALQPRPRARGSLRRAFVRGAPSDPRPRGRGDRTPRRRCGGPGRGALAPLPRGESLREGLAVCGSRRRRGPLEAREHRRRDVLRACARGAETGSHRR